ncbi:sugar kinase [Spirochaetia bacterium]|nr:sugar kinase [Spirochaetia bacterium]
MSTRVQEEGSGESSRTILCADIGTSSLKAALVDIDGHSHGFTRETYGSGPVAAVDWERALARALGVLFSQADHHCTPNAICISGNGPTLVPLTHDGETLPPLHWYQGQVPNPAPLSQSLFLPQVLRFIRERPGDYAKTRRLFSAQEWLSWRLGADPVTALPASYEPYYWDDAQCESLGLDRGKFPPFVGLGTVIGQLSPDAVHRLSGLAGGFPEERFSAGIPIIAGGVDFIMALIGTGAVEPGLVCDRAGTSEGINLCTENIVASSTGTPQLSRELRVLPHVNPDYRNVSVIIPSSGRLFEWYRILTGQERRPYDDILAELIKAPGPLSPDVFFFPENNPVLISRAGLYSRVELGQAVLLSLGFTVRAAINTLGRNGFPVAEMCLSGGQSKSPRWNQLKADLTGVPLLVPELQDGELGGDAVLGAIALGEAANFREGIARIVHIQERYTPAPEAATFYSEQFQVYRELQNNIQGKDYAP